MKSWILEINDHPSFNILTCKEFMGCRHLNCPISEVDLYVKKRVMTDAIKLAFKSRNHESIQDIDSYRSLERIFPLEQDSFSQVYEGMTALRQFFAKLSGRSEYTLKSSQFESLHKSEHIKACGLKRIDLTMLF